MSGIPILIEARGINVLVVGGGAVAARKVGALSAAGARVRVVAPLVGDAVRALADAGRVTLVERPYQQGDVQDAELVIAATNERATNAAVAADAHAAHRLVNVVDSPADGTFSTMATHRTGGLTVGVSAGVPAAAARIRDAIAVRFDVRYGAAVDELAALRDRLLASGEGALWRTISTELIATEFCDAVEGGTLAGQLLPWT